MSARGPGQENPDGTPKPDDTAVSTELDHLPAKEERRTSPGTNYQTAELLAPPPHAMVYKGLNPHARA